MGRKKIQITRILDERNRQVTFMKRKFGLMKKAYELSVLCDCEIALIIFNSSNKLFQYASTDMDKVLLKYTEYNEPHESRTNSDIVEALNKKEHRGCDSPDADSSYILAPSTEEKYKKINEEFDHMMRTHKISTGHAPPVFLHGVPYSSSVGPAPAPPDNGLLAAAHSQLQRNNSPQRPTGTTANGFVGPSSGGSSSMGKILQPRSPPTSTSKHKTQDLRVFIPLSKNMSQNNHRVNSSQSSQPLSTPVVSMTTPSLHQSLVYSGCSSAYTNDYSLNSAQLSGFSPSGPSLSSMAMWQQHQLNSLGSTASSLTINANHNLNIKAEPPSPPRDHLTQSRYMRAGPLPHTAHPSVQAEVGRSPTDSMGSSCSSQEGCTSDRDEHPHRSDFHSLPIGHMSRAEGGESPTVKRMRMDSWVT
ncbi:myocyte-specific enhancer factor 2A-like [Eucyclogobius newberryi]|uniref:myocyte-specific enhancer factor 2A-like n=1 Tax=Eucyclogobius newberryi TaxID=166745 RepID=UPI003B5A5C1E